EVAGGEGLWGVASSSRFLPQETREYVPLILAAIIIARNPVQYGLNVEPVDTPGFETVTLPKAVDLRRVAEWTGTPVETIQDLNPELRRWTTPVRANDYALKVPEGAGDIILARMAQTEPTDLASLRWYTVKNGETLLTVARKLKVNRADLAEANYLSTASKLRPGQQLVIPRAPTLLLAARTDNPAPVAESRSDDAVVASNSVAPTAEKSAQAKLIYEVKSGDTLSSIAKLFQTPVASLKQWNGLHTNSIKVGDRLMVFQNRVAN